MTRISYCCIAVFPKTENIGNVWQIKFESGSIESQLLSSVLSQISSQKHEYIKKNIDNLYILHLNHKQRTYVCTTDSALGDPSTIWDFLSNLEQDYLHIKTNDILKVKMQSFNELLQKTISSDMNRMDSLHVPSQRKSSTVLKSSKSILE